MSAPGIELTLFRKGNGPLTKRIWLEADGSVKSDSSQCLMSRGWACRIGLANLHALATALDNFLPNEAIATGTLRPDLPDQVEVVTKYLVNGRSDVIARSQEYVVYRAGSPALVLIDFDRKGMPPFVAHQLHEASGLWNALCKLVQGLDKVGRVGRASTSAGLYNAKTGQTIEGSGGFHYYVLIKDGADAERFLKTLHDRCWLNGYGWYIVGKAGQLLERSLVDKVCGTPERLAFEGGPVVVPPLAQDAAMRRAIVAEGEQLDSLAACPLLSSVEKAKLDELHAKERHQLAGACAKARELYIARQASLLAERTGMDLGRARKTIERQCDGILLPDIELPFDDPELKGRTVADVLADPARFEGETLADPVEGVEYGVGKACIMRRSDGSVFIHSFAHGRSIYELRLDFTIVKEALERAENDTVANAFVRLVLAADLNDVEVEQLKAIAAKRADIGVQVLARMLKAERERQAARLAAAVRQRRLAERRDPRPLIPVPMRDAEYLPEMKTLNAVFATDKSAEPATRNPNKVVAMARKFRVPSLHALTSMETNVDDDPNQPPASARAVDLEAAE